MCVLPARPNPRPYAEHNRAIDVLVNDPTSLLVLGRRLPLRRLDMLQQRPEAHPRGTARGGAAVMPGASP
jgi:hypothetical protein